MLKDNNEELEVEFNTQKINEVLNTKLEKSLLNNMINIREMFSNSSDLITKRLEIASKEVMIIFCEGMINLQLLEPFIIDPIDKVKTQEMGEKSLFNYLQSEIMTVYDKEILYKYKDIFASIMSGNVVILIDGENKALSAELVGYSSRAIEESENEVDIRSSRESFVEPIKINLTMIRRRIKSPVLKFDNMTLGEKSQTNVTLVYLTDVVDCQLLRQVKTKLSKVNLEILLDSSFLSTYLSEKKYYILPEISYTERPDVLCGKISEGRVAILVDGCPHAIIIPHLFIEDFQKMDDYTNRPVYASFMRILRFFSFFASILMPGLYVAISTFHPEMFPQNLLFNVAVSQEITPFPIMIEALFIHFVYELMREAGLRLPKQIGYAVSIVGALVIGESAVSSGIIGAPMVIIVAFTAITSFIMTSIYQSVCILKFVFIILGGLGGVYGLTLGFCLLMFNMFSMDSLKIPYLSPISPFNRFFMRDTFVRRDWKYLSKRNIRVQHLPGSKVRKSINNK